MPGIEERVDALEALVALIPASLAPFQVDADAFIRFLKVCERDAEPWLQTIAANILHSIGIVD